MYSINVTIKSTKVNIGFRNMVKCYDSKIKSGINNFKTSR